MQLTYSPATEADIETLFALNKTLIDRYEDVASIDYEKVLGWVRRKICANICQYVRVTADGQCAGYYRFCPAEGKMELDDLYVLPPFQNRGIGTAILQKCIAQTDKPVFLYVFAKNLRAIALYERLGFRIIQTVHSTRYIMERSAPCN